MNLRRILLVALRGAFLIQLILGVSLWLGYGYQYVDVHRTLGVTFVLVLWATAISALFRRQPLALVALALVWGVLIAAVGFSQQRLITGDYHWVVRCVHLAMAMVAMPIAERLARLPAPASV